MRKVHLLALMLCTVAVGCERRSTTTTTSGEVHTTAGSTETGSFDRQFIDMMVPHHEQGIMMATMAVERAEHPELKAMARKMLAEQQREVAEMKSMRNQWFGSAVTPIIEVNKQLDDSTFDTTFLGKMIEHHKMAIDASERAMTNAAHGELKELARRTRDEQTKELEQMRALLDDWDDR
jgi:uncharacterized protein (DUF305 family)